MPVIKHEIYIAAPINFCFDFARTVETHAGKSLLTVQHAIDGITSGQMENGDWITWETKHFGIRQTLTSKIIMMEKPYIFTDVMVQGAFHSFQHIHEFKEYGEGTIMKDTFTFRTPFGLFGKIANWLFLEKYMRRFIANQAYKVKNAAEKNRVLPKQT